MLIRDRRDIRSSSILRAAHRFAILHGGSITVPMLESSASYVLKLLDQSSRPELTIRGYLFGFSAACIERLGVLDEQESGSLSEHSA